MAAVRARVDNQIATQHAYVQHIPIHLIWHAGFSGDEGFPLMATQATKAPARPTLDTVINNNRPNAGSVGNGGLMNDSRPTVSGKGDAGAIIHVLVDGREVGTATVQADGTWSYTLTAGLTDSLHKFTAYATNDAGRSLPTAAHGVVVDTTPPAQPTIGALDGQVLSGRAEPNSTVTVYDTDGRTVLGTTQTRVDGTWSMTLPDGMSGGSHTLTVTATDLAGNTSVASTRYDASIGLRVQAMVDSFGKDSGDSDRDWLTNDGSAGRLVYGHLNGALAAGEKVQVSTDGGVTWQDAIVRADGTWVSVDMNTHGGNWTIAARVVNADGVVGDADSHGVTLDVSRPNAPASLTVSADGRSVEIELNGTSAVVGDKVHLVYGAGTVAYTLTDVDIRAGSVTVSLPPGVESDANGVAVGIVDQAGNVSQYRELLMGGSGSEGFDDAPPGRKGTSWSYGGIHIEAADGFWISDVTNQWLTNGKSVWLGAGTDFIQGATFTFDFRPTTISFTWGAVNQNRTGSGGGTVTFYDASGRVLGSVPASSLNNTISFTSPTGSAIASMKLTTTGVDYGGSLIDNFKWEAKPSMGGLIDAPHDQYVTMQTGSLYGGPGENVFHVADVADLAHITQIAGNGGIDTLKLTGAGQVLDVTELNSGVTDKITGIEKFDIGGTGANTLKLSVGDVMNLGAVNGFRSDGYVQVMVNGDADDTLVLSGINGLGSWTSQGQIAIGVLAYNVYLNTVTGAEVLVQASVTVHVVADTGIASHDATTRTPDAIDNADALVNADHVTPYGESAVTHFRSETSSAMGAGKTSFGVFSVTLDKVYGDADKQGIVDDGHGGRVLGTQSNSTSSATFELNDGKVASHLSIDIDLTHAIGNEGLRFYDESGKLIFTYALEVGTNQHYAIDLPNGLEFAKVEVFGAAHQSMTFDNIVFGGADFVATEPAVHAASVGGGMQAMSLMGENHALDMSSLAAGSNPEVDAHAPAAGEGVLKVSLADVLSAGHDELFQADSHVQPGATGEQGSLVDLHSQLSNDAWTQRDSVSVDGASHVASNAAVQLDLIAQLDATANQPH
ncbi:Ig-like domain-containing protein [Burkholderia cenocepacia]|uniref:Ig-like domain-containing protein n=1 Tax=Burkholderia cenocepacia TaxID=95486 RepID=UPI00265B423D|nr:Ig-like domain-containing protein [Burkholderia cenocepacia]